MVCRDVRRTVGSGGTGVEVEVVPVMIFVVKGGPGRCTSDGDTGVQSVVCGVDVIVGLVKEELVVDGSCWSGKTSTLWVSVSVESSIFRDDAVSVERMVSRRVVFERKGVMSGECCLSAAGKVSSRNSASPVTKIRCDCLSQSLHARALSSMPTSMCLFAMGSTFDFRCLFGAKARQPNGFSRV